MTTKAQGLVTIDYQPIGDFKKLLEGITGIRMCMSCHREATTKNECHRP